MENDDTIIIERPMTKEEKAERAQWAKEQPAKEKAMAEEARRQGYTRISDPVFFQWQRGEKTEQDWHDAIAEVTGTGLMVAGEMGTLYRSGDYGDSWETLGEHPYDGSWFGVSGTGDANAVLVGVRRHAADAAIGPLDVAHCRKIAAHQVLVLRGVRRSGIRALRLGADGVRDLLIARRGVVEQVVVYGVDEDAVAETP